MKFNPKATALVAVAAAALVVGGTAGATAGALITHNQIADNAVHSDTIKDGGVKVRDLSDGVKAYIDAHAGQDGAPGAPGADGQNGTVAGVQTNWVAKDGATINGPHSVTLTNAETPAGASVEIEDLNKRVQALQTLSFTYDLNGGAAYAAGSPRVFFQIGETYYNTFDGDPSDAGVDNGDGTFTKTVTIPANGTIHAMGVVSDSGVGSVTVTDLTVNEDVLAFQ